MLRCKITKQTKKQTTEPTKGHLRTTADDNNYGDSDPWGWLCTKAAQVSPATLAAFRRKYDLFASLNRGREKMWQFRRTCTVQTTSQHSVSFVLNGCFRTSSLFVTLSQLASPVTCFLHFTSSAALLCRMCSPHARCYFDDHNFLFSKVILLQQSLACCFYKSILILLSFRFPAMSFFSSFVTFLNWVLSLIVVPIKVNQWFYIS